MVRTGGVAWLVSALPYLVFHLGQQPRLLDVLRPSHPIQTQLRKAQS
jgi:hypothetical protein